MIFGPRTVFLRLIGAPESVIIQAVIGDCPWSPLIEMKTSEIASRLNGTLDGDPDLEIHSIADLESIKSNQLGFFSGAVVSGKFVHIPEDACLIVPQKMAGSYPFATVRVEDPRTAFARISQFLVTRTVKAGTHETFVKGAGSRIEAEYIGAGVSIGRNSVVGSGVQIHAGARLGDDVEVGMNSVIHSNVTVYDNSRIGENCVLHAGAVIGAPGFGYVRDGNEIIDFPQIGVVVLENRVEIGANTCVDRGALGETRIGEGTKIDNLVQVGHNVSIGKRVLIAAQVGISGSVVIEDEVVIGGQVGIADHVTIKKGAVIGARSAVFPGKIVRAGVWAGTPVQPIEKYKEQNALVRSLGRLKQEIKDLQKKLG